MTPREKAKELFRKFVAPTQQWDDVDGYITDEYNAKQCALITVDEIIKTLKDNDLYIGGETNIDEIIRFWQEVKQEIEKL